MDKKKTKNKNHNKKKHSASNQLAKFRGWIQAGATLLTNIHLPNFFKGEIYQGKGKAVCVPGLNCYSCPAASGACPIGSFQAVVGSSKFSFSYYITGFLILLGVPFDFYLINLFQTILDQRTTILNVPAQFEQVDTTCGLGGGVFALKALI